MRSSLPIVAALVRKDLVRFVSSPRSLLISLAAPVLIAAFFGSLFGGADRKPSAIPVVVIDRDDSAVSRRVVAGLKAEHSLDLRQLEPALAEQAVRSGKVRAVLVIPPGFGAAAARSMIGVGARPVMDIRYDPSQAMALAVVKGLLTQQVMQQVAGDFIAPSGGMADQALGEARARVQQSQGLTEEERGDVARLLEAVDRVRRPKAPEAGRQDGNPAPDRPGFSLRPPYELRETAAQASTLKGYNSYSQSFAGMGVQFVLFMAIDLGVGLLLMRREGLWKRYRSAPLSRPLFLGATLLSMALIAAVLLSLIFLAGILVFGVRIEGSVGGFVLIVGGFSMLAASLGLLLAAMGNTPEATRGLAIFVTLVLMMLGGAWVPSFVFPEWLQTLSLFMPTTWAIDGLAAMTWRGLGLDIALRHSAVLAGFSVLFAMLAIWQFKWEE